MNKAASGITSHIFDELIVTVESIGVDKTIKSLQQARTNIFVSDNSVDNIINIVVEITGIKKERILHGKDKSEERKIATALCIYFLKQELQYSYSELKKTFQKDESAIYRYHQFVLNIPKNPKTEFDKKLSEYQNKIELLIKK
jgi:hypothetical protein